MSDHQRESDGGSSGERAARDEQDGRHTDQRERASGMGAFVGWATETVLRLIVALVGVVLLLFALGRIVGINLYSMLLDLLQSEAGRWSIVAVFAVLLILAASGRWYLADSGR